MNRSSAILRAALLTSCLLAFSQVATAQRDVTFLFGADPQYARTAGWQPCDPAVQEVIVQMNLFNWGDRTSPWDGGETVARPRGVLLGGDLTHGGVADHVWQLDCFTRNWTGADALLYLAPFEGIGNHDTFYGTDGSNADTLVAQWLHGRNPSRESLSLSEGGHSPLIAYNYAPGEGHYAWTWDDVRFVQLNEFAGGAHLYTERSRYARNSLKFLACDLETYVGTSGAPVVIVQHYGLDSFSTRENVGSGWIQEERDELWSVIENYNVIAIFSGHCHNWCESCYTWDGSPIAAGSSADHCDLTPPDPGAGRIPNFVTGNCGGGEVPTNVFGFAAVRIVGNELRFAQWASPSVDGLPDPNGWGWRNERIVPFSSAPTAPGRGCDEFGSYCPGREDVTNETGHVAAILNGISSAQCGYGVPLVDIAAGTYATGGTTVHVNQPAVLRVVGGTSATIE